ncbi:MAG: hypothetical protein KKA81_05605 [Bacteroidetes bacterium]|nr:hypothetical protein [Bacteroidota bacterium]
MEKSNKYFKAVSGIILALLVVISTGGVLIFEHHCACNHKVTTHLIPVDHSCCHDGSSLMSCCSGQENESSCPAGNERDCCQTIPVYLKISSPFETGIIKQVNRITEIESLLAAFISLNVDITVIDDLLPEMSANPPPILPCKRIISFHQLKIAPPEYSI